MSSVATRAATVRGDADIAVLRRYARTRDAEAFADLFSRYQRFVYATCLRILRDRTAAEDATQECFLALARRANAVNESLGGWLHQAATGISLNIRKKRCATLRHERAYAERNGHSGNGEGMTWAEAAPHVDAALERLPGADRLLLVEHFLRQRSFSDLARELGSSPATLSRRTRVSVQRLRRELKKAGVVISLLFLLRGLAEASSTQVPVSLMAALGKMAIAGPAPLAAAAAAAPSSVAAVGGGLSLTALLAKITAVVALAVSVGVVATGARRFLATAPSPAKQPAQEADSRFQTPDYTAEDAAARLRADGSGPPRSAIRDPQSPIREPAPTVRPSPIGHRKLERHRVEAERPIRQVPARDSGPDAEMRPALQADHRATAEGPRPQPAEPEAAAPHAPRPTPRSSPGHSAPPSPQPAFRVPQPPIAEALAPKPSASLSQGRQPAIAEPAREPTPPRAEPPAAERPRPDVSFEVTERPVRREPSVLGTRQARVVPRPAAPHGPQAAPPSAAVTVFRGEVNIAGRTYEAVLARPEPAAGRPDAPSARLHLTPIDPPGPRERWPGCDELSALRRLGDGFYQFSAGPLGDRLRATPYRGPLGTLRVGRGGPGGGRATERFGASGSMRTREWVVPIGGQPDCDGILPLADSSPLPAGDYHEVWLSVALGPLSLVISHCTDVFADPGGGSPQCRLHVARDAALELDFSGQPALVILRPEEYASVEPAASVGIRVGLMDPLLGIMVRALADTRGGPEPPPPPLSPGSEESPADEDAAAPEPLSLVPTFAITDSCGRVVARGSLPFQPDGTCGKAVQLPEGVGASEPEECTIEVTWDTQELYGTLVASRKIVVTPK